MKTKFALLLAGLLHAGSFVSFAQANFAPAADAKTPTSTSPAVFLAQAAAVQPAAGGVAQAAEKKDDKPAEKPVGLPASTPTIAPEVSSAVSTDQEPGLINIPEAPLTDVISTLARQANINFQFDPKITGGVGPDGKPVLQPSVSIRWENVTALQALEALLVNHSLVMLLDPKTKIARITVKDPAAPEPLVTRVIQLKYANPTNMVSSIQPTLNLPRSKVLGDSRTSKLIVMATEKEMETVDSVLAELDVAPKQVLIEARLLETSKNPSTIKGIDWSGTLEAQKVTFGNGRTTGERIERSPGTPITTTTTLPSGRTVTSTTESSGSSSSVLNTVLGNGGLALNTAKGFHPATAFLNADGVSAVLSFLNKDSDTEVVATPRTVTLDNQTATLSVTRAFPIFQTTPGTAQTPAGSTILYTNLGTILTVTPRISANSNIALKVVPEVSNIDSKDTQVQNGQTQTANVYAIRRIETQVVIPSGHTLVMGGLISDSTSKQFTKVPVLGDLPGIGLAFRRDSKVRNKSNLLVFITPTIVGDGDFQPIQTDFLKSKIVDRTEMETSAWDTGEPVDWTKGRKKKKAEKKESEEK